MKAQPGIEFGWDDVVAIWSEVRLMARWLIHRSNNECSWRPTSVAIDALKRLHQKGNQWGEVQWEDKTHFINACLKAMRSTLYDRHRRNTAAKRPPRHLIHAIETMGTQSPEYIVTNHLDALIAFQQALEKIAESDTLLARVLEARYICGYTPAEAAVILDYSERHMRRLFAMAKLNLDQVLEDPEIS
jgi:DNA-directed RNA polymerase specialized sigma24 family protein